MNRVSFIRQSTLVLVGAAIIGGCTSDTTTEPEEDLGRVIVTIKDENNAPVSGILVDLFLTTNSFTPWAATTTGADGTGEFSASSGGVKAQAYVARVISLTSYTLGTGETNNKPITVVANQTTTVSFTLTKRPIVQN